ncbi:uncharacterized protein [Magallana gigas]|uniref:uncharacterized protein isoform X3 n=1 Tax=Magallana gigas TaxID=29159 RepID=UPI00333F5C2A
MERTVLFRLSLILVVFHWIPHSILFFIFVCDCFGAYPTNKTLLLPNGGSAEVPIRPPEGLEEGPISQDVALGWNLTEGVITDTEIPGSLPTSHKTHAAPIRERSAKGKDLYVVQETANESCQLLKEIQNNSTKGSSTIYLGVMSSEELIVIQSYPSNALLRYLCEDEKLSPIAANFTTAMSECSLLNITVFSDNFTDMDIKEPTWINYENIDRSDTSLHTTLRVLSYNYTIDILPCCNDDVIDDVINTSTVSIPTTPTEKTTTANEAITVLIIFIATIFGVLCFTFLLCKVCCTPKRRPSYKVEYADPSDVIISSSGAEYSTPYDTCQSKNRIVKVTGANKNAGGKRRKISKKSFSFRFGSSRLKGRKRENDSGFSDLMESEASRVSGREDQLEAKETQYMEIPLVNIHVPVSKSLSNPSYTYVEGKTTGQLDKNKKETSVRFTIPISEPRENQISTKKPSSECNNQENPYECLSDNDQNYSTCNISPLEKNKENPYALPDCDSSQANAKKSPEADKPHDSPYAEINHETSERPSPSVTKEERLYM